VPVPGMSKTDHAGIHHAMVAAEHGCRKLQARATARTYRGQTGYPIQNLIRHRF
jgi:hypothetical protein